MDHSANHRFVPETEWLHGLPELNSRDQIAFARKISNPGCYAIDSQLASALLTNYIDRLPTTFGVSGYSDAYTKPSPKDDPKFLVNNLVSYTLTNHMYEHEIFTRLGHEVVSTPYIG